MNLIRKNYDLANGYVYRVPKAEHRVWMMLEYGFQAILMLSFQLDFNLSMHPFHFIVYDALGCGVSQLSPNILVQVSGVIARCVEVDIVPSLELLFSIYHLKLSKGQLYLDTRPGRTHLVSVPSSYSGWHP